MSEFNLINQYFSRHRLDDGLGVGDDCAIITPANHKQLVICTDTLIAGRHFVHETAAHAIGYKAVAVNLSDLAAMGATPHSILLALSLPSTHNTPQWLSEFSAGIYDACNLCNVKLIGGDTTKSDVLTITITAQGFVTHGLAITRAGAKIGDVVCISGAVGTASFALHQILEDLYGDGYAKTPTALDELPDDLKTALQYPTPQVVLGQKLIGYAHSMIDISDGLAQDLGHILSQSGVGARLDLHKIPLHPLINALPNPQKWHYALNGGDDYELCFTLSKEKLAQFKAQNPTLLIYEIGEIVATQGLQLLHQNRPINLPTEGWQHF